MTTTEPEQVSTNCPFEAVFSYRSIPCTLPSGHEEPHSYYGPQVDDREPDGDVTPALGAALTAPDDPILLSPEEWVLVLRVAHLLGVPPAKGNPR